MTYQHLSQTERYQIYILMKDGKTQTQIAKLMDRHKSTISRELARNTSKRGYRPRQACLLSQERSLGSSNATQITAADWGKTVDCLLEHSLFFDLKGWGVENFWPAHKLQSI